MKCPECVEEGKKSCVMICYLHAGYRHDTPFYDEDGTYHDHDASNETQYYRCTREHDWSGNVLHTCPNPNCDWTSESRATAPPKIKEDTPPPLEIVDSATLGTQTCDYFKPSAPWGQITTGEGGGTRDP